MWFFGNGFRNRLAFEIGARSMGADVTYIPGDLGTHEPIEAVGQYLSNWFSLLVVRAKCHDDLLRLADHARIPVVNARTSFNHPCEVLGDLHYIRRIRGSLEGLRVVFVGAIDNVCRSWFEAAVRFPIRVVQVCPQPWAIGSLEIAELRREAKGELRVSQDLENEIDGADVLYTDCWPKNEDRDAVRIAFVPFQIQKHHVEKLSPTGFYLPCPPVTQGEEVSAASLESPLYQNIAAKEHLLHVQSSILEFIASQESP
jgi:ornithine carbamoyltransferase